MTELDLLIGKSQRDLSRGTLLLLGGVVFTLLIAPLCTPVKIDATVEKLLYVILGGLISSYASQNQFWFGRPRNAGVPDPASTVNTVQKVENMTVEAQPKPAESTSDK